MTRLVIVGKHGYIASALCRWLDRESVAYTAISSAECNFENVGAVEDTFARFGTEELRVVFTVAINPWLDNSPASYERNRRIVKNFVTATRRTNLHLLIYLSTVDVYGRCPALPISENSPLRPDSWYARAKCECEEHVLGCRAFGVEVTVLRLPGIYGPGGNDRSVVGKFVRQIATKGELLLHGGGHARRDFVFIDDLCAIIQRVQSWRESCILNVATGVSWSMREIASLIGDKSGLPFQVLDGSHDIERAFDLVFDNAALLAVLPDFRFTSVADGINAYLQENSWEEWQSHSRFAVPSEMHW